MGRVLNRLVDVADNKSVLPVRVREAARMRIAELNDCPVCLSFRATSVKDKGVDEDFYRHVSDHETSDLYSSRSAWASPTPSGSPPIISPLKTSSSTS